MMRVIRLGSPNRIIDQLYPQVFVKIKRDAEQGRGLRRSDRGGYLLAAAQWPMRAEQCQDNRQHHEHDAGE